MNSRARIIQLDRRPLNAILGGKSASAETGDAMVVCSEHTTAHELTHVVQQSGMARNRQIKIISADQFRDLNGLRIRLKLEQIFRAAQLTNQILLFDEADALFGSRAGVRDAHDRNANMQTNYLLDVVTKFGGCVFAILASNGPRARLGRN